jgi:PPOX class probable F420-dependent enzyme
MDDKLRNEFLSAPNTAVLATVDAKGRAHAVPVWYLWTGNVFEIIGGKDSAKMKHVELNGRAALCVDKRGSGAFHITAEGPCELGDTATKAWRLKLHTHYRGTDAAARVVADDGHLGQRFLTLQPERWYGWTAAELK